MRTLKEIMGNMDSAEFAIQCINYKFFCEHVLALEIMPFHLEWINLIQQNKRIVIIAPTGFGKSMVLGKAFCLYTAYLEKNKEMAIVSKTLPQARKFLEDIKIMIEDNELLRELIPPDRPHSNWCSADMLPTSTGCKIYVQPYSERIRGIHVDYLFADEISSYEDHTIWHSYVATRVMAKDGTLVGITTPRDVADLSQELLNNKQYTSKVYPAIQNDKSIWPTRFPVKKLEMIKATIGVAAFEREYMLNPRAQMENALYPPHLLVECFDFQTGFTQLPFPGYTIIGCDFAIAAGPRADWDAYVVLNKHGDKATLLHGERHRGFTIAAKVDRLVTLFEMYRPKSEPTPSDEMIAAANIKFVIDPSSVGMAVYEELRGKGYPVECAKFDSASRNQMLINLRQMIEKQDIIIPRKAEDPLCLNFTDTLVREMIAMASAADKDFILHAPIDALLKAENVKKEHEGNRYLVILWQ